MNESSDKADITLIGAGLAGSLLSVFLAKRGFAVEVFERRPDMRSTPISAGRSINMALSTRGIHALQQVGLYEAVMKKTVPMRGRLMHSLDGEISFHPYGKDDTEVIYSISRALLNITLMDSAERHPEVRFRFEEKCTGFDFEKRALKLQNQRTGTDWSKTVDRVIGTDGSASAIRADMSNHGNFHLSQQFIEHGYKELAIPPAADGGFMLEKNALHIWPRKSFMLIALPNLDGSFTCTLFYPMEGPHSFASLDSEASVISLFEREFHDALSMMPALVEDFFTNPTGALGTVKCRPWHIGDQVALLGDAAHAMVPFFGQGMNCSFEDCTYLDDCLEKHGPDWHKTFQEYEDIRRMNTSAIQDMALENFIEMRDHVADEKFLLKKDVEIALEKRYPTKFIPRYSMVSFHRIPYSLAQKRGVVQQKILTELCHPIQNAAELDWTRADELVHAELSDIVPTS